MSNQGWICPKCESAWAPHVARCQDCAAVAAAPPLIIQPAPPVFEAPQVVARNEPTVDDLVDEFLQYAIDYEINGLAVTRTAVKWIKEIEIRLDGRRVRHGSLRWNQLSPHTCKLFRAEMKLAKSLRKDRSKPLTDGYINRVLTELQRAMKFHVEKRGISHNPVDGFHRVSEEQFARQTLVEPEAFYSYIQYGHPMLQDISITQYECFGMRPGEARLLRKAEVSYRLVVNKTTGVTERRMYLFFEPERIKTRKNPLPVPVPPSVQVIIERNMRNSRGPYVFVSPSDPKRVSPIPASTINRWNRKCRASAKYHGVNGEEIVLYHFRHGGLNKRLADKRLKPDMVAKYARTSLATIESNYRKFSSREQDEVLDIITEAELIDDRRAPRHAENDTAGETVYAEIRQK